LIKYSRETQEESIYVTIKIKTMTLLLYSETHSMNNYIRFNKTTLGQISGIFLVLLLLFIPYKSVGAVNDLRKIGFSLIPAPQETKLTGKKLVFNNSWSIQTQLNINISAIKRLHSGAMEFYGINFTDRGENKIYLEIKPGTITKNLKPELAQQAYNISITPGIIKITANAEAGLFYGVQSFLQLLRPENNGKFALPEGIVTDWPDLQLRFIHWDTKHHQSRIEALKRQLDWAAYFKVNAVAFEIEDKYEYPSHPVIGAPGAYTKAEMQDLTAYARERFIQLVPDVQAPAHFSYVLKHKEFAHLKADGMNYQICMCDDEAIKLILDMYQDMIDATPGVDYFLVSTDEVYFAGICNKCKKEYNPVNRSQAWVDYVTRTNKWMSDHGRRMISWIEFPLLPEDIHKLPSGMIDGVVNEDWIDELNKAGIQQLIYNSIQGEERLFPNYFPTRYRESESSGNLYSASISGASALKKGANLLGSFTAAWDDSGLHDELFWLGWVTGTQYAWSVGKPSIEQNTADFMDAFYGYDSPDMTEVYRLLEDGARFYQDLWDNVISKERAPGYGDWDGKGIHSERFDQTLETLPIPALGAEPVFRKKYAEKIEKGSVIAYDNERLINLLMRDMSRVSRNRYNLEVMLSIAYLEKYTINTLSNLCSIEDYLAEASKTGDDYTLSMEFMVRAYNTAGEILKGEQEAGNELKTTWEKSRFEKCRSVNGKDFVWVLDDLKDHFADRRMGLNYMLAPFERMEIEKWQKQLMVVITDFSKNHNIPINGLKENL
jgi:hexosaminidase